MRSPGHFLFFADRIDGAAVHLDGDESRHAVSVLRAQTGDEITATDGSGSIFRCRIAEITTTGTAAVILEKIQHAPLKPGIALFIGLPEKEALERVVEELTPLGVARIVPLVCAYCQEKWWERSWESQEKRLRRKMIAAVKQSRNPFMPFLQAPQRFEDAVRTAGGSIISADRTGGALSAPVGPAVSCFIGPPGGFSDAESGALKERGARLIKLGPYRLRTELAATLACGMLRQRS